MLFFRIALAKISIPVQPEPEPEQEEASIEETVMDGLKVIRQAEEERMRNSIVREWDIGKEGVKATEATDQEEFKEKLKMTMEKRVLNQQEWVDQKRKERQSEFAPPSNYVSKAKKAKKERYVNQPSSSGAAIPPPPNYTDYSESKKLFKPRLADPCSSSIFGRIFSTSGGAFPSPFDRTEEINSC